ncbi:hypothetical protein [Agrococcus jejuensis]|uniref:Uncharacterized protein n=1 Tax=Agrococcus jejuensis TaxID=399736 RepID=A0A1G8BBS5_9MICO|nr:hypothetical protein [Agrococcus jejuensis]SDH30665.1 hypothetical protein SAMN04489720_0874 [Agrococcus jejuensis]
MTTCADLDSPEAAAIASGTMYVPTARPFEHPSVVESLPAPSYTGDGRACAFADGRLVLVTGLQADVWQELAAAVTPTVLGT